MISVIILTYNQEKYLVQTLESLLMQKCDEAFEILIGDDCSTDDTGKIADVYQKNFPNFVRVIRPTQNLGASRNFVNVLKYVRGEYLSICDGDDYWLKDDVLQKQLDTFRLFPDVGNFAPT